jgi:hypothetical protein
MENFIVDNTWQCYTIISLLVWLTYEMNGWSKSAKNIADDHGIALVVVLLWPAVILYIIFLVLISIPVVITDLPGIILNLLRKVNIGNKKD